MHAGFERVSGRILIVDDDIDLLMLLERRLLKEGYTVETACSLPEAEEIIDFYTPQLVLLDININGEDGRQLCWKLKHAAEGPDVRVIVMSGYDLSASRSVLFGADEMVTKPLQTDYLLQRIQVHLQAMQGMATIDMLPLPEVEKNQPPNL
ncbi:MAG TPA: response regulator [Flavisolibacter sp.]|nr:response regulator [Flavisolibacter sp.]